MKKKLLSIAATALLLTGCFGGDDYFSKRYWSGFNWETFETTKFWTEKGLKESSVINVGDLKNNIHRNKDVEIDGLQYVQMAYKYIDNNQHELSLSRTKAKTGECDKILTKLNGAFGEPSSTVDRGQTMGDNLITSNEWQWNVGNSYINLNCLKNDAFDDGVVDIRYKEVSEENKLEQPITLSCSYAFTDAPNEPRQIKLVIFPKTKRVLNGKRSYIGKVTKISETEIDYDVEIDGKQKAIAKQSINRTTGKIEVVIVANGSFIGAASGSCVPGEVEAPKKIF